MRRRFVGGALLVPLAAATLLHSPLGATPPPTPVPPNGSPSPFPTVLKTPKPSAHPPKLTARAAALADLSSGQVLYRKNGAARRPIASLTKLMTALLVLSRARPSERVKVGEEAARQTGSRLGLRIGERIRVGQLLYALLLQSSNDAAIALADYIAGSTSKFVHLMNRRAKRLDLDHTRFFSPTGLDDRGYSSPLDLAALAERAFRNPTFRTIVRAKFRTIRAPDGPARRIQNRNALLWLYRGAIGGKSGFTSAAGHCLVAAAKRGGRTLIAVVLGAPTNSFNDAAALLNFGFIGFRSVELIRAGQSLGVLRVQRHEVPVIATGSLVRLVPATEGSAVVTKLKRGRGLRLPIAAGQVVGQETVSLHGRRLGSVTGVAAETVVAAPVSLPSLVSPRFLPYLRLLEQLGRSVLEAFL
jgi:serine-type D-Ala-D-Ala carboxypeptidase (penicillin-binding protein 5/6)